MSTLLVLLQPTGIPEPNRLGPDPFLYHPARLGTNHPLPGFSLLASVCALPSSLAAARPRSLFALVTSNFAAGHPFRFQSTRPSASAFWNRTIAFCGHRIWMMIVSLSPRFSLRSALLSPRARPFSIPSRPSGTEPLPSRYCSLRRSHIAPVTANFPSSHRTRCQLHPPVPHHPWPGGMREPIK